MLVLRNDEYSILKWFAMIEEVGGAPGLDLPALDVPAVAEGYGVRARRVEGPGRAAAPRCARRSPRPSPRWSRSGSRPGCRSGSRRVALLAPDPRRIADPPEAPAADDRVPDALAAGTPEPLRRDLCGLVGADRVLHRVSDLVAYASDASPYRLIPQAVVVAHDADDVRARARVRAPDGHAGHAARRAARA